MPLEPLPRQGRVVGDADRVEEGLSSDPPVCPHKRVEDAR
jgi:hypothetical protein